MTTPLPHQGQCERCCQTRPLFPRPDGSNSEPKRLCAPCWSLIEEARERGTFADWNDAFDNATDEQIVAYLNGSI